MPKKKPPVVSEEDAEEEVEAEKKAAPEEASEPKASEDPAPAKAEAPSAPEFKPHDSYPPISKAEVVEYCPVCGLPPDFCQHGTCWDKCKPVCMEKFPQYYPELAGASLADAKKTAEEAAEQAKIKELPGGKKKREKSPEITIKKLTRSGRKCVTSVQGLEGFDVKLESAAKIFKKKFSCGASVVGGDGGLPETVDIQGDFEEEVVACICKEFPAVKRDKICFVEGGTKKKAGKSSK